MRRRVNRTDLELVQGDITEMDTEAIVNAANSALKLGGGVAGAIARKGGPTIQQECDRIGHCPVGGAVITSGGNLRARWVIHAVGPRMGEGDEDRKLRDATLNSLKLADSRGIASIAFPAISTGIFGFPIDRAAEIFMETIRKFYQHYPESSVKTVQIVLFDERSLDVFNQEFERVFKAES